MFGRFSILMLVIACDQTVDKSAKNKSPTTRPVDQGEDIEGFYTQTLIPKGDTFTIINGKTRARINGDQPFDLRVKLTRVKSESLTNGSEVLLGNSAVSDIIRIEVYDAEQDGNNFVDQTKLAPIEIFTTVETETPDALSVSYVDKTTAQSSISKVPSTDLARTAALHLAGTATEFSFPIALAHATIAVVEDETINAVIKVAQRHQIKNSSSSTYTSSKTSDDDPNEIRMQLDGSVHFNCLLRETGKLRCWGGGAYGKLGTGDGNGRTPGLNSSLPLSDIDLGTGKLAKSFTMGREHACALLTDGSVKCWGQAQYGQLGIIPVPSSHVGDSASEMGDNLPAVNFGTGRTAVKIASAGQSHHTCAVLDNGIVKCWGEGSVYKLGTGSDTNYGDLNNHLGDAWPAFPNPAGTKAIDVAVGSDFTCILFDDKKVRCIGLNTAGQLGFNSNQHQSSNYYGFAIWGTSADMNNLQAVPLSADLSALYPVSIQATKVNACAVMNNDSIKCWGDNSMGQLGHNEATTFTNGAGYPAVITSVRLADSDRPIRFWMGADSSCIINRDYKLKCWGYGGHGRLGNESENSYGLDINSMDANLPTVSFGTGRLALEVGGDAAWCALLDNFKFKCFGLNDFGQAGSLPVPTTDAGSMGDNLPYQPL
jgi:alpha-tubulin suppressor-like RCC1 family protein